MVAIQQRGSFEIRSPSCPCGTRQQVKEQRPNKKSSLPRSSKRIVWVILSICVGTFLLIIWNLNWVIVIAPSSPTLLHEIDKSSLDVTKKNILDTSPVTTKNNEILPATEATRTTVKGQNNGVKQKKNKQPPPPSQQTEYAVFNQSEIVVVVGNQQQMYDNSYYKSNKVVQTKPYVPVLETDFIYSKYGWNSAPVVIHSHKLLFFTVQKVGCTVWKQLMRRMMKYKNWRTKDPANPKTNGLTYLYHYNVSYATELMNSPEYTRAIFVRDPKEKFLSAFIDKAHKGQGGYFMNKCSPCRPKSIESKDQCRQRIQSFPGFVEATRTCHDSHWGPQSERMEAKYLSTIDFVGHFDTLEDDAVRLLKRINAYDEFGANGWGKYSNESIFHSAGTVKHASGKTARLLSQFYTPELEFEIEQRFANDYLIPQYNLTKHKISFS